VQGVTLPNVRTTRERRKGKIRDQSPILPGILKTSHASIIIVISEWPKVLWNSRYDTTVR